MGQRCGSSGNTECCDRRLVRVNSSSHPYRRTGYRAVFKCHYSNSSSSSNWTITQEPRSTFGVVGGRDVDRSRRGRRRRPPPTRRESGRTRLEKGAVGTTGTHRNGVSPSRRSSRTAGHRVVDSTSGSTQWWIATDGRPPEGRQYCGSEWATHAPVGTAFRTSDRRTTIFNNLSLTRRGAGVPDGYRAHSATETRRARRRRDGRSGEFVRQMQTSSTDGGPDGADTNRLVQRGDHRHTQPWRVERRPTRTPCRRLTGSTH